MVDAVDAVPIRAQITWLLERGMSWEEIAGRTACARATLQRIHGGAVAARTATALRVRALVDEMAKSSNSRSYYWNGEEQVYLSWCNRCQSFTRHSAVESRCLEHR